MAAAEANTEPVQVDAGDAVETKAEEECANAEAAPAPTEETAQATTEAPQSTEQPADKVKPASEKIWDSFLNKSGLGKVMGGKKKKEHGTVAEDAPAEETDKPSAVNENDQEETAEAKNGQTDQETKEGETGTDEVIEKVADNEEAALEQKATGVKVKQSEKSSVRDFIRKPVAKIFSHKSTDKKDSSEEGSKHGKVRSKSLDRMEDAAENTAVVDQVEDAQAQEETDKSASQTAKPKRWHSFKKLMAQRSHKKSTDDSKDVEGAEGGDSTAPGDTGTLDSTKSEQTGQKRWKLKRSWTFQGLKRDPSIVGIHKPKDKDSIDAPKDENPAEEEEGAAQVTEESKLSGDGETQEKPNPEGEEDKEATAATSRTKHADHHSNEIWTSFKKRVIPKSKKAADAGGGDEEPANDQEQNEEPQAGKDSGKTAKTKRTHFNRAVSLKNFILRKGKGTSMDMGEGAEMQKETEEEPKNTDDASNTAGETKPQQDGAEDQATTQSESNNGAQVADEHKASDGEDKSLPDVPSGAQTDTPHSSEGGDQSVPVTEVKTNGENGCSDAASEETTTQNHDPSTQNDVGKVEEINQDNINSSDKTCPKDGKVLNQDGKCSSENAVAQSEKKAGNV